jgi:aryl-alcohol dehydrogenase-like predicted oxidoreductase
MNEPYTISRLTLGTVQLGLHYGIANKAGKPSQEYSHKLLEYALENGINTLDTARIYGSAEDVIGSFEKVKEFTVVSKFKLSDESLGDKRLAIAEARESLRISCSLLKRECIPIVLFHKNMNQSMEQVVDILPFVFETLIGDGLISNGGISVYKADELNQISEWENMNFVQVPINVFDTRLLQEEILQKLKQKQVTIFARSIYLQGLLAMERPLPGSFLHETSYFEQLKNIAAIAGRPVKEIAFSFVRDTPQVNSIVIGAETIEQLSENIQLLQTPPLSQEIYNEIREAFRNMPEHVITPALWKN